jgi:hypothetical protein
MLWNLFGIDRPRSDAPDLNFRIVLASITPSIEKIITANHPFKIWSQNGGDSKRFSRMILFSSSFFFSVCGYFLRPVLPSLQSKTQYFL